MNKIKYVKKHPKCKDIAFEELGKGDLLDVGYYGLDEIFRCEWTKKNGFSTHQPHGEKLVFKRGDIFRVKLGFALKLPDGHKAQVVSRSSTRKNFNIMLTNNIGQIDNSYSGTNDEWLAEFIALDDGYMEIGDRILQFEIIKRQNRWEFEEVDSLNDKSRGGYGSTGK